MAPTGSEGGGSGRAWLDLEQPRAVQVEEERRGLELGAADLEADLGQGVARRARGPGPASRPRSVVAGRAR